MQPPSHKQRGALLSSSVFPCPYIISYQLTCNVVPDGSKIYFTRTGSCRPDLALRIRLDRTDFESSSRDQRLVTPTPGQFLVTETRAAFKGHPSPDELDTGRPRPQAAQFIGIQSFLNPLTKGSAQIHYIIGCRLFFPLQKALICK